MPRSWRVLFNHRAGAAPTRVDEKVDGTLKRFSIVVGPINKHRPANNEIPSHKTPRPTVEAVVAIVSHHEIRVFRHFGRLTIHGKMKVGAGAAVQSLSYSGDIRRRVLNTVWLFTHARRDFPHVEVRFVAGFIGDHNPTPRRM